MAARHAKYSNRMRSNCRLTGRTAVLKACAALAVPILLFIPQYSFAQSDFAGQTIGSPGLTGSGLDIFSGKSTTTGSIANSKVMAEVLRGTGSRLGYRLSHGNVLPATMRVNWAGRSLKIDTDYWVDSAAGSLIFAQPIRPSESVSVYYRYLDGPAAQSQTMAISGLQFNLGGAAQFGLTYNNVAGDGTGVDTSLYGLSLGGKFGGNNLAQFGGLAYVSNTQLSKNFNLNAAPGTVKPPAGVKVGMDHLFTESLDLHSGQFQFHTSFQDVGKNFAGFQALKANNLNNKPLLDQLTALEGEKGVRRLGFGMNLANDAKGKLPGGLALQWNKIEDATGAMTQEAIGYTAANFHANFATRDVSSSFASFKGLRDADKLQWEREKGMKSSALGLGFNFGVGAKKKGAVAGGFSLDSLSFEDQSGSYRRDLLQFSSGNVGLMLLSRRSGSAFRRLGDVSDADKTALALDLYRQFDPAAQAAQVTAVDKVQVAREAGLDRQALRLDDKMGKGGQIGFSSIRVTNATPSATTPTSAQALQREAFALQTGPFSLNFTSRRVDPGFSRLADLSDIEKSNLALDTRRQFDPNATLAQITPKDRDLLAREFGISRENLRGTWSIGKLGKSGVLQFSQFRIGDTLNPAAQGSPESAVEGLLVGYSNARWHVNLRSMSASSQFSRYADLSDADRASIGNLHGLDQKALDGAIQLTKKMKVSFSGMMVGGTDEAARRATSLAAQNGQDISAAEAAARAGVSRYSLAIETPGLNFAANRSSTSKEFNRAADLALPDPERKQIEAERGTQRNDYTLHYTKLKGLTLDGSFYNAEDARNSLDHTVNKVNAQYALNKKGALSFQLNTDLSTVLGKKNGVDRTLLTLNQEFGRGYLVGLVHDDNQVYADGAPTAQASRLDSLRFETPKVKKNTLSLDLKRVTYQDGRYENTTSLLVHAKPTAQLSLNLSRVEIDRGDDATASSSAATTTPTPSEATDSIDLQWQATKQFAIVMGVSQKDTTDRTDADTISIGLQGNPSRDVTLAAKFDEVHNDGKNTKDVADFSISNSKPLKFGIFKDVTISGHYASLNDMRRLQNETMTGRASWKIWKNEFVLDYGGITKQNGEVTTTRLYSFTTDPNPKKWFHGGFYYKVRTLATGEEKLIRRFTADWRLTKSTSFVYTYGTMPEDDKGNILPQEKADISLKHAINQGIGLELYYRLASDNAAKKLTRGLGLGIEGKIDKYSKLSFAYSIDTTGNVAQYDHSNRYHFLWDRQFDADHFISLSTDIRSHDGHALQDEIQANVDFRFVF